MTTWTPPSKMTMILALLIIIFGIILGIWGLLDLTGQLPPDFPINISSYNQILIYISWILSIISWIIIFIGIKMKGV